MEEIIEDPTALLWLLLPFFGIAAIIAFVKLKLFGNEKLHISWLKNDKTYYRKTFSHTGTHSFSSGRGTSGSSSRSFSSVEAALLEVAPVEVGENQLHLYTFKNLMREK